MHIFLVCTSGLYELPFGLDTADMQILSTGDILHMKVSGV